MKSTTKISAVILIILFTFTGLACSQPAQKKTTPPQKSTQAPASIEKSQPFRIRHADNFRWEKVKGDNVAVLVGKVEIYLEKDQISISADSVIYHSEPRNYKAIGHVKITKTDPKEGKIVSNSQQATYAPGIKKVTLEGSPKVMREKDEIIGDILIITFEENGAVIEGTNIQGILYPNEK
jgi:lipopolysaccharide transport protein LptA